MAPSWIRKLFARPSSRPTVRGEANPCRRPSRLLNLEQLEGRVVSATVYSPADSQIGRATGALMMTAEDKLVVDVDVASNAADRFDVTGAAQYAGTLEVRLAGGNDPAVGSKYTIATSTGSAGAFDTVTLPELANGKRFVPVLAGDELNLVVAAAARPVRAQLRVPSDVVTDQVTGFLQGLNQSLSLTGAEVSFLGQSLHGDFTFGAGRTTKNLAVVVASVGNVSASLGGDLVSLRNGTATVFLTTDGVAASASVDVSLKQGLGVSFSGSVALVANTAASAFDESIILDGKTLSVTAPAGPFVRLEAHNATLGVINAIGSQEVSGSDLVLEAATETAPITNVRMPVVRGFVAGVSATLGSATGPRVQISEGTGGFVLRPEGVAAQFSGKAGLLGVSSDLTLAGQLQLGLNNTGIAVNDSFTMSNGQTVAVDFSSTGTADVLRFGGALDLDVGGFVSVHGGFGFQKATRTTGGVTTEQILVGVSGVNAFFGDPGATSAADDDTGVLIEHGTLGLVLNKTGGNAPTYALDASGGVRLVGLEKTGLTLGGTAQVRINNTGAKVDESIAVPGAADPVAVKFASAADVKSFGGTLDLDVGGFVSLHGSFGFQKSSTTTDGVTATRILVGVTDLIAFVGDPGATSSEGDDTGVRIKGGKLGLVLDKTGDEDATYALYGYGGASLVGDFDSTFTLSAQQVNIRKNTTGKVLDKVVVPTPSGSVNVAFGEGEENLSSIGGVAHVGVDGFVAIDGAVNFSETTTKDGSKTTTKILVAAADVSAFFGANGVGVQVYDARFGLMLRRVTDADKPANNSSTYALDASGRVKLVGLENTGLTLGGAAEVRINNTGGKVDESIPVPGAADPVALKFDGDVKSFGGALDLDVGGFVHLSGGFSFARDVAKDGTATILVAAGGVRAFVGFENESSDLGFQFRDGRLALKVVKPADASAAATYALDASGSASLIGFAPVKMGGTFGVKVNTTGAAFDTPISVPNPDGGAAIEVTPDVKAGQTLAFSGTGVTLSVLDTFTIGGDFAISRNDGRLDVDIANAALSLYVNRQEVIRVGGGASFSLGGTDPDTGEKLGFHLNSFSVGGFSFFPGSGVPGVPVGGSVGSGGDGGDGGGKLVEAPKTKPTKLGPLSFSNPSLSIGGFDLGRYDTSTQTLPLSITVGLNIGSATFALGSAFSATATGLGGSFEVAVDLGLQAPFVSNVHTTGKWELHADSVGVKIGEFLELSATGIRVDPGAGPNEDLVSFDSVGAAITAGGVRIGGTASHFAITGGGDFVAKNNFSVGLSLGSADPLGLPSWLPLKELDVTIAWPGNNFNSHPLDFQITVDAKVKGSIGAIELAGSVEGLVLDVKKLRDGAFPIVGLSALSVGAKGNIFGGHLAGEFIAGIIRFDANGARIAQSDHTTDVARSVFYCGIEGGFDTAGFGAEIRIGFSDQGLLSAYLSADVDINIPLTPFALSHFHAGIEFNAPTFPSIDDPQKLRSSIFKTPDSLDADEWLEQLQQQVVNQAGSGNGFVFSVSGTPASLLTSDGKLSSTLVTEFLDRGYSVSEKTATVTALGGGSYLVRDGKWLFVLDPASARTNVSRLVTSLDAGLIVGLDGGTVTPDVRAAFAAAGYTLSDGATLTVNKAGEKWTITVPNPNADPNDGASSTRYVIEKKGTTSVALVVTGTGSMLDDLKTGVVKINAGARLKLQSTPEDVFRIDADILATTDGKFLIAGKAVFAGGTLAADAWIYTDLSQVSDGKASIYALADVKQGQTDFTLATIAGSVIFQYTDAQGNPVSVNDPAKESFQIVAQGSVESKALQVTTVRLQGDVTLTFSPHHFTLVFDASLSLDGILSAQDAVQAAGRIEIDDREGIWGVMTVDTNLKFLEQAGLKADGELTLTLNSTTSAKDIAVTLPNRAEAAYHLLPTTLALEGAGTLSFASPVSDKIVNLKFDGAFAARISVDTVADSNPNDPTVRGDGGVDLDLLIAAGLNVGLNTGDRLDLLTFDALGLIAVRDVGAFDQDGKPIAPTIASRIDMFIQAGIPGIFTAQGSAQLLLNSSGQEFKYEVPNGIKDQIKAIQARRKGVSPDQVSLPALPALGDHAVITVPDSPPQLLSGDQLAAGPYFCVQLGDVDQEPGSTDDSDNDGLTNVSVTLLNVYKFTGAFRITAGTSGFEVAGYSQASWNLPGIGDLFKEDVEGVLSYSSAGLIGAFRLSKGSGLTIPGVDLELGDSVSAFIGINTTSTDQNVLRNADYDTTLAPRSARLLIKGDLHVGGFVVNGLFSVEVGATAIQMMIDAKIDVFNLAGLEVKGTAAIYYGARPGLALDAMLKAGASFGSPGLFDIGADLHLKVDTREGLAEIALENVHVSLLRVVELTGSAKLIASGNYFRIEGSFNGTLLSIVSVHASGFFDNLGNFELDLDGRFQIGTDSWGVQAGGHLHILRDMTRTPAVPLEFDAGLNGRIVAGGITLLGAGIGVTYSAPPKGDGRIAGHASIDILFIHIPIDFTLGYLVLDVPDQPRLADVTAGPNGNTLSLNVGAAASRRNVAKPTADDPNANEQYTITSIGPGTRRGEKVQIQAFGASEVYDDVVAINGDFGDGNDQLFLGSDLGTFRPGSLSINVNGGSGNDLLVNQSDAAATLTGGSGDDLLISSGTADYLDGGDGNDTLYGGAGATVLGGADDDTLYWQTAQGAPASIDAGAGSNTLVVVGTAAADEFALDGSNGRVSVGVTTAGVTRAVVASGIGAVQVQGVGGADKLTASAAGLTSVGVTKVLADLSLIQGRQTPGAGGGATVATLDDGAPDAVTLDATGGDDAIDVTSTEDAIQKTKDVQVAFGGFVLTVRAPNGNTDSLTVNGGAGKDTFTVAGEAARRVKLSLLGGDGDDTADVPLGLVSFDGGAGANTLRFAADAGTASAITLSSTNGVGKLTAGATTSFQNVASLVLDATATSKAVSVQSTPSSTDLTLKIKDGTAVVTTTGGALDLAITGAGSATINRTGGATTVAAGAGSATVKNTGGATAVTVGSGSAVVSTTGGDVTLDVGSGTATLGDAGGAVNVTVGTGSASVNGTRGDVTVSVTSGTVTLDGTGGAVTAHLTGDNSTLNANSVGGTLDADMTGDNVSLYVKNATANVTVSIADTKDADRASVKVGAISAGAHVTVTAAALQDSTVTLGEGLLSRLAGTASLVNVRRVVYDNSNDTADGSYTISDAGVNYNGVQYATQNAREIELVTGYGNDTVTSTLGDTIQSVQGRAGNDVLTATLAGDVSAAGRWGTKQFGLRARQFERVNFTYAGAGDNNWKQQANALYSGADVERDPLYVLDARDASALNIKLGDGKDTFHVADVLATETLDLGGGANSVSLDRVQIGYRLDLKASGGSNSLAIKDDDSLTNAPRTLTLAAGAVTALGYQPITYSKANFTTLAVNLGPARDTVIATDLPADASLSGGDGDDVFILSGNLATVHVYGQAGNDTLILRSSVDTAAGPQITFDGGTGNDTVAADRSDAATNLTGSLTARNGQPVVALDGIPSFAVTAAEYLQIKLGAGNDRFDVDSAGFSLVGGVDLFGGPGDDVVTFTSVGGGGGPFTVYGDTQVSPVGDTGQNTVVLKVAATPSADEFLPVVPRVQKLVIDHSAGVDATAWSVEGYRVKATPYGAASAVNVIDAEGATQVQLIGGSSRGDTLQAAGSDSSFPVAITLTGNVIAVDEGLNVLRQSQPSVSGPSVSRTFTGLNPNGPVATSADGSLVFISTTDGVSVFRSGGVGGPLTDVGRFDATYGGGNASNNGASIAATADGKWLFLSNGSGQFHVYEVNVLSGVPTLRQTYTLPSTFVVEALVVSPDGKTLAVVGSKISSSVKLLSFSIDSLRANGALGSPLTVVDLGEAISPRPRVWFSPDSQTAFVSFNGAVQVTKRAADGSYQLAGTVGAYPGLDWTGFDAGNMAVSADGRYLFGMRAVNNKNQIVIYALSGDTSATGGGERIRQIASFNTVGGSSSPNIQSFAYLDDASTLVVTTTTDQRLYYPFDKAAGTLGTPTTANDSGSAARSDGKSTVVLTSADTLLWQTLSSGAVTSQQSASAVNGDRFIDGQVLPGSGGVGGILGLRLNNAQSGPIPTPYQGYLTSTYNSTDYQVYDPTTGDLLASFTTPYRVVTTAPYPVSTDGTLRWWSLERDNEPGSNDRFNPLLVRYSYSAATGIVSEGSTRFGDSNQEGRSATVSRIFFTPDGADGYITGSSFSMRVPVATAEQFRYEVPYPGAGLTVTAGYQAFTAYQGVAFAGDLMFASDNSQNNTGTYRLRVFDPVASGSTAVYGAEERTAYTTGDHGDAVSDTPDAVAGSVDGTTVYVRQSGGTLVLNKSTLPGASGYYASSAGVPADISALLDALAQKTPVVNGVRYTASGTTVTATDVATNASRSVSNNQTVLQSLGGATVSAVSVDGRYQYAYSASDKALGVYDTKSQTWATFFDGYEVPIGALTGVSSIAVSQDASGAQYALLVSSNGTLTTFRTQAADQSQDGPFSSSTTIVALQANADLAGARSLYYSRDEGKLYAATATAVRSYAVPGDFGTLPAAGSGTTLLTGAGLGGLRFGNSRLYVIGDNGSSLYAVGVNGALITGLSHVTDLALVGGSIYAASSDGLLYALKDTGTAVTRLQTFQNYVNGVRGLAGAGAVAVSPDGAYVFVAGTAENSIAVFSRNATDGTLTFAQSARDGRTASGITQPTGLYALSSVLNGATVNQLIVASDSGRNGRNGGFAVLDVAAIGDAVPTHVQTTFSHVEGVTLTGGTGDDVVSLLAAPTPSPDAGGKVVSVTVNTVGGNDAVNVADVGPKGTVLTINTGDGDDQVTVNQATDRSAGVGSSTLTITAGAGNDRVDLNQLAPLFYSSVIATVNLDAGGSEVDVVQVSAVNVSPFSSVTVRGDLASGSGSSFAGDALIYDGQGAGFLDPNATIADTINLSGYGPVSFTGLHKTNPQQVFLVAAPRPTLSVPPFIKEGDPATLTAGDSSNQSNVTYSWDLNGDGTFGDATGSQLTLTWAQLKAFGIIDGAGRDTGTDTPRSYPLAVRATTTQNAVQFGGQLFQLSADASGVLRVFDTPPTLAAVPGSATLGVPFTIPLAATDPASDRVQQWSVNWGDGTTDQLGADAASASHIYAQVGDFTVMVTARGKDGDATTGGSVRVRPGVGSVGIGIGALTTLTSVRGTAGSTLDLVFDSVVSDLPVSSIARVTGPLGDVTGSFTTDPVNPNPDGGHVHESTTWRLTFANALPAGSYTVGLRLLAEGEDTFTATATAFGSPVRYDWDFGADGSIEVTTATPTLSRTWAQLNGLGVTDNGTFQLRMTAVYSDGVTEYPATSGAASFTVTNTPPTGALNLNTASVQEGSPAGAVKVTLTGYADPSPADTAATARVAFDFDNDGTIDLSGVAVGSAVDVPAAYLTGPGLHTLRAVLSDKDHGGRELFATFEVTALPPAPPPPPPLLPALSLAPVTAISEGGTASLTVHATGTGAAPVTSWLIAWGDGTSDEVVTGVHNDQTFTHAYADGAVGGTVYEIFVTARTAVGDVSGTAGVTVNDIAPTVTLSATSATVKQGDANALAVQWTITDPGTDRVTEVVLDWGDGTSDVYSGDVTSAMHTYATVPAGGHASVKMTALTNDDGVFSNPSNALTVTVNNAGPVLLPDLLRIPQNGTEATPIDLSAVAASVATGSETLTFAWTVNGVTLTTGAGTSAVSTTAGYQFVSTSSARFTPLDDGDYEITLTVTDPEGATATVTRTIVVANVAPTIDAFTVPDAGSEGTPVTFGASASDVAGAADPLTYAWTVTDTATNTIVATSPTANPSFTLPGGSYVAALAVFDGDGGTASRSARLTVVNHAQTVVANSFQVPATGYEAQTATFRVAGADDGGASGLSYRWRVTDRAGNATFLTGAEVTYTWPDDGLYTVQVTITDHGGLQVTQSAGVTVANVAPTVTPSALPSSGTEGVSLSLRASATDPAGARDPLSFVWTLTPAAGAAVTLYGPNPTFTPPDNGDYAVSLTVSDGDGGDATVQVGTIGVVNVAPAVSGTLAAPSGPLSQGQTARLTAPKVTDVAADLPGLDYSWTITPQRGDPFTLHGAQVNVPLDTSGTYQVSFVAVDKDGDSSQSLMISFDVANLDPRITAATVPAKGYVGLAIPLSASATDVPADQPNLVYQWTISGPNGAVTLTGAAANFTPTAAGSYYVALEVTDGVGGKAATTGTINVLASPVAIRSFVLPGDAVEGAPVKLYGRATDDLGGAVTLTWTVTPSVGQAFTLTGNDVSFTRTPGTYGVSLTAASVNGTATVEGIVKVANLLPTITSVVLPSKVLANTPIGLSATARDAGGDAALTYTWTIKRPLGAPTVLTGRAVNFVPRELGDYGVRLEVSDRDGGKTVYQTNVPVYLGAEIGIAAVDAVRPEGTGGGTTDFTFAVTLSNAIDYAVTVAVDTVDGTAREADGDYVGVHQTLTFQPGGSLTQMVTVRVNQDSAVETDEAFTVRLSNPTYNGDAGTTQAVVTTAEATGTILDDDHAALSISAPSITEGSVDKQVKFAVTLDRAVQGGFDVAVGSALGSASASDFTLDTTTLHFAGSAGEVQYVTVTIKGDDVVEADETFSVTLGAVSGTTDVQKAAIVTGASATGTIVNDDVAKISIKAVDAARAEGAGAGTTPFTFCVTLSNPADHDVTVDVDTLDGTAKLADGDYQRLHQTLTFRPGEALSQTVTVLVNQDNKVELDESFVLRLSNPTFAGATDPTRAVIATADATGIIVNDDSATLSINDVTKAEGDSGQTVFTFTVTLSAAVDSAVGINFATAAGTAIAGKDYVTTSGSLTFAGAAGETKTVTVQVLGDTLAEFDDTFAVNLSGLSAGGRAVSVTRAQGVGTIVNDDRGGNVLEDGTLLVVGTAFDDDIEVRSKNKGRYDVEVKTSQPGQKNSTWSATLYGPITRMVVDALGGDNEIDVNEADVPVRIQAGDGDNEVHTGKADDTVVLGNGNNSIWTQGGNDKVTAGNGCNEVRTGATSDVVILGNGNNRVWTSGGADSVTVGDGDNEIRAGKGDDTLRLGNGNNRVWTDGGNDTVTTGDGNNEIHAGDGNNVIKTGKGNDSIWTGKGNDTIDAGDGDNYVSSGDGNDYILTGSGKDYVDAGAGDDFVRAGAGNDTVLGGAGNDVLIGGDGDDVLYGGDGRDLLIGGFGADRLYGGSDDDVLIAGSTVHDGKDLALMAIMKEWTSAKSLSVRVANLEAGTGLAGGYRLVADGASRTVIEDTSVDTLVGASGSDWFFANRLADNGGPQDVVTDTSAADVWTDTDL